MIHIKTSEELEFMRQGGRMLGGMLDALSAFARVGMTTKELSERARQLISEAGAEPSFLNYNGYPDVICRRGDAPPTPCAQSRYEILRAQYQSRASGDRHLEALG
jgi:hypothetical protein